jgi:hypothetical protein
MSQLDTAKYQAHKDAALAWPSPRCNTCGHTSCIDRFEEESCNYDGCPECNAADHKREVDEHCRWGEHDWWEPTPGVLECIVCSQRSDDEYMACPHCGTQVAFYKAEACGPRPTWIISTPQHFDDTGFTCSGVGAPAISRGAYEQD